ncbi:hypothetical protein ACIOC2_19095 [Streptomyces sp. NPDC088337]|uniref:hypothetical protein n=1 Tax=unclassified Streptomyces TaxID=2593676 RepID=UPI003808EE3C
MTVPPQSLDDSARDQVRAQLLAITGRALTEVRVTRVHWPDGPRWVALALVKYQPYPTAPARRREIPLAEGSQHYDIALLLSQTFPDADWSLAQDYDVNAGVLRPHTVRLPACLRGEQP